MAGLYDLRGVPDGQVGCRASPYPHTLNLPVIEARKMAGLYDLRGVPDGQVGCRA